MSDTEKYPTLADFMEHVSLVMDKDDMTNDNKVMLITLHSAKGLSLTLFFFPAGKKVCFRTSAVWTKVVPRPWKKNAGWLMLPSRAPAKNFTSPWRITAEFTDSGKTIFRHGSSTNFRRQTLKSAINALTSIAGIMVAVRITKTPIATAIITVSLAVGTTIRKAR